MLFFEQIYQRKTLKIPGGVSLGGNGFISPLFRRIYEAEVEKNIAVLKRKRAPQALMNEETITAEKLCHAEHFVAQKAAMG